MLIDALRSNPCAWVSRALTGKSPALDVIVLLLIFGRRVAKASFLFFSSFFFSPFVRSEAYHT